MGIWLSLCVLASAAFAHAATNTWNGSTSTSWGTAANWTPATVPGAADTATFNNAGNGRTLISLGSGIGIVNIIFDTANAAAYTFGSGTVGSQTLNMNGSGMFNVTSTVTNTETFNAALTLSTAGGGRTLGFTNDSTTPGQSLIFAGGMTTTQTGTKTVSINGAGNTSISGILSDGNTGGQLALTKNGTGMLTLSSGPHTYSGPTLVNGGTLVNSSIGGSAAASATLAVGNLAGVPAVLDLLPGANVTNYSLAIGGASGGGAVYQSGGTFTQVQGASIADFRIGDGTAGYGYYQLSGGTLVANEVGVGGGNGGNGTIGAMDISGGTFYNAGWITVGRGGTTSSGVLNVYGNGSIVCAGTVGGSKISYSWGSANELSVINIFNGGSILGPANTAYVLDLATGNSGGALNEMNLGPNGTLAIGGVTAVNAGPVSLLNFNGGTLRATTDNAGFLASANIEGVFVYPGGAIIDDGGFAIVATNPLQTPAGYGVNSISLVSGGAGYIGPPLVSLTGGTGIGASAIAQVDSTSSTETNILVTNPGSGYASGDVLSVSFIGGGGSGAVANTPGLTVNQSGGLTKSGSGTLTLSGASTYTGTTTVSAGTLVLGAGAALSGTNINVGVGAIFDVSAIPVFSLTAGESLMGSGTVSGAVSMVSSSGIFAGTDGGIGTLTFNNSLNFASGASACFDLSSSAGGVNDQIVLNGTSSFLDCSGASVSIKCGSTLDQNDYTLFNVTDPSSSIMGSFQSSPVWSGTVPANAAKYSIVTSGSKVLLHYNTGVTNSPTVANLAATAIKSTTATLNGQVLSTGGELPTVRVYYGTNGGGINPAAWTTSISLGTQVGSFAAPVSNLAGNTTYYFAASASNSAGVAWGTPSLSFTMLPSQTAVITNLAATSVQGNSAILNGQVLSTGSQTPAVTLYYGPSDGGTNAGSWANSVYLGSQGSAYSYAISGLATNTIYYFSASASNNSGNSWASPSLAFSTLPTGNAISMLTFHYDNSRLGANTNETILTPAIVNTNNFGLLTKYTVDGYVYTEPLYVPNVTLPGKGTHNVVIIATEHDTVYAFDADGNLGTTGGLLWKTNLGISALCANQNAFGARYCGNCYPDIVPEVGVTGTPVIDPSTGSLFLDVFTRESGAFFHRLHSLNITNGAEQPNSPVVVTGSVPGTGVDSVGGVMTFNASQCNERPALTLAGGAIYLAYAGYADTDPYHGWVLGYNATNLARLTNYVFNSTPNATTATFGAHAAEGGVWQGGNGLCVDANTNLYFETGNGSFDGNTGGGNYADSFLKLSTTNKLALADYFTPYNQLALANADTDLGACGPILLPDSVGSAAHPHLLAGTGKSGVLYLVDRDNMGHYNGSSGNDSNIVQSFAATPQQTWSSPAYFNNQIYLQPSGGQMKAYVITNGHVATPAASSATVSVGAYNGGPVISANGTNDGIVWMINGAGGGGTEVLYAFAATNISKQLYNSSQLSRDIPGNGIKMITPTVANGKVYVGAQYSLAIYGLTAFLATPVISPNGAAFTNSVLVTLSDTTPGTVIYYTLDGTAPTTSSTLYTGPFSVMTTANLQAIAVKSGTVNSGVASASFINTAAVGSGIGLSAQYWTNITAAAFSNISFSTPATLTRTDAVVNFDWSAAGPDPSIGQTNFTARWTGTVQPQYEETYTFTTVANDGLRLWINGQLLIDDWNAHSGLATNSANINLRAQQLYNIRLDFFQQVGTAGAQLRWSSLSTAPTIVPQSQLYPETNPPPTVIMASPADGSTYTGLASVTVSASADAPLNPITEIDFYANGTLLGTLSNSPTAPLYTLTATGLTTGSYALTAVARDGSGLSSTSAPVNITVTAGSGLPYGLSTNSHVPAFLNMPGTSSGSMPALLSGTGAFSDTSNRIATSGLIPYQPNTPLWSDAAVKSRYLAVPNNGSPLTPDEQIGFLPTNSWTFRAGTVFVKNFDLVVNETNASVPVRRLETRLLVRDINGDVYGVTYKWRPDNSDADLLAGSLNEDVVITNATGVRTQTWYYPSPADCLTCHTPLAGYVLGVNARQLNGSLLYPSGNTDNQLRTLNRLGLFNPAINEANIPNYAHLSALTNTSASLEERARSYLDANCAQCHRPGNSIEANFDARYDTPLANQNITNYLAQHSLGIDGACVVKAKDIWRSVLWGRINTNTSIKMPPLARNLIDTNAVQVFTDWINSLPGTPALAPASITPNGGTFMTSVSVSLQSPDPTAAIYYTLDGSLPTTNSLLYSSAFNLFNSTTVTASAFKTNLVNSANVSAAFNLQPLYFTSQAFTNGMFRLSLAAAKGSNYVLEASTNLTTWTPLFTNVPTTNLFDLFDTNATDYEHRFYRVREQ